MNTLFKHDKKLKKELLFSGSKIILNQSGINRIKDDNKTKLNPLIKAYNEGRPKKEQIKEFE